LTADEIMPGVVVESATLEQAPTGAAPVPVIESSPTVVAYGYVLSRPNSWRRRRMDRRTWSIIAAVVVIILILGYALGWFGGTEAPTTAPAPAPGTTAPAPGTGTTTR
jgi:hypothetical protein